MCSLYTGKVGITGMEFMPDSVIKKPAGISVTANDDSIYVKINTHHFKVLAQICPSSQFLQRNSGLGSIRNDSLKDFRLLKKVYVLKNLIMTTLLYP